MAVSAAASAAVEMATAKRSRVCHVCRSDSGNFFLNYGASVCFSCRAFFRRVVQASQKSSDKGDGVGQRPLKCRSAGGKGCTISADDRKCRKCRYEGCISAGMKVDMVLGEEQKEARFRRSIKKKKRMEKKETKLKKRIARMQKRSSAGKTPSFSVLAAAGAGSDGVLFCGTIKVDEPVLCERSSNGELAILFRPTTKLEFHFESLCSSGLTPASDKSSCSVSSSSSQQQQQQQQQTPRQGIRKTMQQFSEKLQRRWGIALAQMKPREEFRRELLGLHRSPTSASNLSKALLKLHLVAVAKLFADFALQCEKFRELSSNDQRLLLLCNTPLFAQYLLGRCFSAPTGAEQVDWWLLPLMTGPMVGSMAKQEGCSRVTLSAYNKALHLFDKESICAQYQEFIQCMGPSSRSGGDHNFTCVIAKACLFTSPVAPPLDDADLVRDNLSEVLNFAEWSSEVMGTPSGKDVQQLMGGLGSMRLFFDEHVRWSGPPGNLLAAAAAAAATSEEERWLANKLELFDAINREVGLGGGAIQDLVRHGLGVATSSSASVLLAETAACWAERLRRLLAALCPLAVDPAEQARALEPAVALCLAKTEDCLTGNDQLRFVTGGDIPSEPRLAKLSLREAASADLPLVQMFCDLSDRFSGSGLLRDARDFKLVTLAVLLEGVTCCTEARARCADLLEDRLGGRREATEGVRADARQLGAVTRVILQLLRLQRDS